MRSKTPILAFVTAAAFLSSVPASAQRSHLTVELLQEQRSIQPGGSVTIGFRFRMEKGWHIYWQNPGDSGQTPSIDWSLPDGYTVGDIQWPVPRKITLSSVGDYGYTNEVLLMVPLHAPADAKPGQMARISAKVRWLVCQEICIPGSTPSPLHLRIPVNRKPPKNSKFAYYFQAARQRLPAEWPGDWKAGASVGSKDFRLSVDTGSPLSKAATVLFFPLHPAQVDNVAPQALRLSGSSFQLSLRKSDQLTQLPKTLEGVLEVKDKKSDKAYALSVDLSD
jgi:DsbC/DsbD-like thiol-disulfide interchange protein